MRIIDTNLLFRYFLRDDPQKADSVERLLKKKRKRLLIPDIVFAELVWVLGSVYKQKRETIAVAISGLLSLKEVKINHEIISKSLDIFRSTKVDWIDAYIAAIAEIEGYKGVYSFDRDFDKIPGVRRLEPK